MGYSLWGRRESDTTEQLSLFTSHHCYAAFCAGIPQPFGSPKTSPHQAGLPGPTAPAFWGSP